MEEANEIITTALETKFLENICNELPEEWLLSREDPMSADQEVHVLHIFK